MHKNIKDITGEKFGLLTVVSFSHTSNMKSVWNCLCECGNSKLVVSGHLRTGGIKSCGCLRSKKIHKGKQCHGMTDTREHRIWRSMIERCRPSNTRSSRRYADRGISVCERWMDFKNFYKDMGDSNGLSLDRIDNDKGYTPENCRWATWEQQGNNRSNNVFVEHNGVKRSASQWARILNIGTSAMFYRLKHWPIEKIFEGVELK